MTKQIVELTKSELAKVHEVMNSKIAEGASEYSSAISALSSIGILPPEPFTEIEFRVYERIGMWPNNSISSYNSGR